VIASSLRHLSFIELVPSLDVVCSPWWLMSDVIPVEHEGDHKMARTG